MANKGLSEEQLEDVDLQTIGLLRIAPQLFTTQRLGATEKPLIMNRLIVGYQSQIGQYQLQQPIIDGIGMAIGNHWVNLFH